MSELVLLSGGLDSAVCLGLAVSEMRNPVAFFVDYGQPAIAAELAAGRDLCSKFQVQLTIAAVTGLPAVGLLYPGIRSGPREPRGAYVPARNLVLIALAAAHAEAGSHQTVSIGACADDNYPDTSPAFLESANLLLRSATNGTVQLRAPLRDVSKRGVIALAQELGIEVSSTWSCHYPRDGAPCRHCTACLARRIAENTVKTAAR